jgi:hypothetical protein
MSPLLDPVEVCRLTVDELHVAFEYYFAVVQRLDADGVLRVVAGAGPLTEDSADHLAWEQPLGVGVNGRERVVMERHAAIGAAQALLVCAGAGSSSTRGRREGRARGDSRGPHSPSSMLAVGVASSQSPSAAASPSGSSRWGKCAARGSVRKVLPGAASCAARPWASGIVWSRSPQTISVGIACRR